LQAAIVIVVAALVIWLGLAVREALARKGIQFSFDYLGKVANFSLSEGLVPSREGNWPILELFSPSHSNLQALLAGLWNSLKVALSAIVLCTLFGTLVGIGRLSTNWLVRKLAWNMPYHAEHHAYPGVPFHRLPEFHALIESHLKETEAGYVRFHKRYVGELK